jgi:predicted phage terminase large subunit-like protein
MKVSTATLTTTIPSTISPDELLALGSAARANLAARSFPYYCEYVHGRTLFPHQKYWVDYMLSRRGQRLLIVAPPESLKSTLMRMYLEWCIGRDPDTTILLVMNTSSQAQRQVVSIEETIENSEKYHEVFPNVIPHKAKGWSREYFYVHRSNETLPDPTLYGSGYDGPYQGLHVKTIVVDDPTDQKDVRSSATMEQQRERVKGVLLDRLLEGGDFFVILTRWSDADLTDTFRDIGFEILENPIEGRYPWGRLLFPEHFPDDRLTTLRTQKGGALYSLTYLCNPAGAIGAMLKREWWRRYSEKPKTDLVIHSWDLSTGRSASGDPSAYGEWQRGEDGYYLTDAGTWHLSMDELIKKMKLLYENRRPRYILVEDVGTSIPVVDYLKRHTRMPIIPIKPGSKDKASRVQSISALIEAGRVWLPAMAPWADSFISECATFPGGSHDDQVDQMSQALGYLDKKTGARITEGRVRQGEPRAAGRIEEI